MVVVESQLEVQVVVGIQWEVRVGSLAAALVAGSHAEVPVDLVEELDRIQVVALEVDSIAVLVEGIVAVVVVDTALAARTVVALVPRSLGLEGKAVGGDRTAVVAHQEVDSSQTLRFLGEYSTARKWI